MVAELRQQGGPFRDAVADRLQDLDAKWGAAEARAKRLAEQVEDLELKIHNQDQRMNTIAGHLRASERDVEVAQAETAAQSERADAAERRFRALESKRFGDFIAPADCRANNPSPPHDIEQPKPTLAPPTTTSGDCPVTNTNDGKLKRPLATDGKSATAGLLGDA